MPRIAVISYGPPGPGRVPSPAQTADGPYRAESKHDRGWPAARDKPFLWPLTIQGRAERVSVPPFSRPKHRQSVDAPPSTDARDRQAIAGLENRFDFFRQ